VAAENNEDQHLLGQIDQVFAKTGHADAGKELMEQVSREIVELNNQGVMAARSGDFEGSVKLLIQAADQVPSLQFLINAAKAIFTLLDRKGWAGNICSGHSRRTARVPRWLPPGSCIRRSPANMASPRPISGTDPRAGLARNILQ
jgi:hypothetical protein